MAWFDKRITPKDLDTMDAKIIKRYGNVKVIRENELVVDEQEDPNIVDESSQVLDDLKREAIDYDEKDEYETIEPETEEN